jgi:hypothetical protein
VKPIEIASLRALIRKKLANPAARRTLSTESVASILERDLDATIQDWMALVEHDEELTRIPLSFQDRTGHLPKLLRDLISRLRCPHCGELRSPLPRASTERSDVNKATPSQWS